MFIYSLVTKIHLDSGVCCLVKIANLKREHFFNSFIYLFKLELWRCWVWLWRIFILLARVYILLEFSTDSVLFLEVFLVVASSAVRMFSSCENRFARVKKTHFYLQIPSGVIIVSSYHLKVLTCGVLNLELDLCFLQGQLGHMYKSGPLHF